MKASRWATCLLALTACLTSQLTWAQWGGLGDLVRQGVEKGVKDAVQQDGKECPEGKVRNKKGKCVRQEQASQPADSKPGAGASSSKSGPGEGVWANYDFVPGSRILFAEDFTAERVGNFPRRLRAMDGNMEVVEWNGERYLRGSGFSKFAIVLPEDLPERWTLEMELTLTNNGIGIGDAAETSSIWLLYASVMSNWSNGGQATVDPRKYLPEEWFDSDLGQTRQPVHLRLQVDGAYMKGYLEEHRLINAPSLGPWKGREIIFTLNDEYDRPGPMLTRLSVNAGGLEMYEALMADGRLVLNGIYFDTGSDRIRPESTGTLTELLEVLRQHAELKLVVEGHTDNVGAPASNDDLSNRRAGAVARYLVDHGVDSSRLTSIGYGQSRPVASNDTPENRQRNRRVEVAVN